MRSRSSLSNRRNTAYLLKIYPVKVQAVAAVAAVVACISEDGVVQGYEKDDDSDDNQNYCDYNEYLCPGRNTVFLRSGRLCVIGVGALGLALRLPVRSSGRVITALCYVV